MIKLGCIADDFTGATDLANNLVRAGMRVTQVIGIPAAGTLIDADAVVVSLKSRTVPAADAIAQSLAALTWLQSNSAEQIYFKYCSTFDSTAQGNIGPVTEALMRALGTDFTIATPAFPDNGRTVFKGHLFVGDVLLSESGMQNHPLTPMTDANLVRVLQQQCKAKVGLISYQTIAQGAQAIQNRFDALRADGVTIAIVDALSNQDLVTLGLALKNMPLVTAGSGVAIGLPQNFGLSPTNRSSQLPIKQGMQAIIAGSCSNASNAQVGHFIDSGLPAFAIDPFNLNDGNNPALAWVERTFESMRKGQIKTSPILIYSTATPEAVRTVQSNIGSRSGQLIEQALANVAKHCVHHGAKQLIIAGGETSGACVQALRITQLQIGDQIDPGVPWCYANTGLHIALKSGNFGTVDFFTKAFAQS